MTVVCRECREGKCRNCDGIAWDLDADSPTACTCRCTAVAWTCPQCETDHRSGSPDDGCGECGWEMER